VSTVEGSLPLLIRAVDDCSAGAQPIIHTDVNYSIYYTLPVCTVQVERGISERGISERGISKVNERPLMSNTKITETR
jgi:hypothetical protein